MHILIAWCYCPHISLYLAAFIYPDFRSYLSTKYSPTSLLSWVTIKSFFHVVPFEQWLILFHPRRLDTWAAATLICTESPSNVITDLYVRSPWLPSWISVWVVWCSDLDFLIWTRNTYFLIYAFRSYFIFTTQWPINLGDFMLRKCGRYFNHLQGEVNCKSNVHAGCIAYER